MSPRKSQSSQELQEQENNGEPTGAELDPIIDGLLTHLPAPGDPFPRKERDLWMQIMGLTLELVYPDDEEAEGGEPAEPEPASA